MELKKLSERLGCWLEPFDNCGNIVMSSRIRLARNLAGCEFVSRASLASGEHVLEKLTKAVMEVDLSGGKFYIEVNKAGQLDKDFLVERHLISRQFAASKVKRGVIISEDESFSAMINEEDHLRVSVLLPGLQLDKGWDIINRADDEIEKNVEYAFHPRLGYLTACPTNVGTGLRVSVMLHLPALKMTGHLDKFFNAAKAMNLAVRGLYGEGTEAVGDFYQVSNQTTLGVRENEVVKQFNNVLVPEVVKYERMAREELVNKKQSMVEDKIFRAYGILKHAQMISSHEALYLLSHLRLGVDLKRLDDLTIEDINRLFLLTQPAHLQFNSGGPLNADERDELRAKIIRESLN